MIYFDNAATSYPKPRRVRKAVDSCFQLYGANPGRSGHKMSMRTAAKVYECRESVAELFGAQVQDVVFTANCTHAINLAIKGCLRQGDHVILSDLEHNAVLRPVHALAARGAITYTVVAVREEAADTVAAFAAAITPRTRLIACTHGSNVFGIRLPIREIGALARQRGVLFLVDAAQTAGVLDIQMEACAIDFLCTAGHKSLYGPPGTGLLVTPLGSSLATLMEGGTGSFSADFDMPADMPDRLECGTVNTAGILGLAGGISFLKDRGIQRLYRHKMEVGRDIFLRLRRMDGVRLYTPDFRMDSHLPVISFTIDGLSSEQVTDSLSRHGFALRGGLHCAPLAHRKMGTLDSGTARISIGAFNTLEQGRQLCSAIERVAHNRQ